MSCCYAEHHSCNAEHCLGCAALELSQQLLRQLAGKLVAFAATDYKLAPFSPVHRIFLHYDSKQAGVAAGHVFHG